MSLIDDLKAGFSPGHFNNAPLIPGATWYQRLPLNTASTVGLTLFGHISACEFSKIKLFDLDIETEVENSSEFACLTASTENTQALDGLSNCFVDFGFIEDATNQKHVLYRGLLQVQTGVE